MLKLGFTHSMCCQPIRKRISHLVRKTNPFSKLLGKKLLTQKGEIIFFGVKLRDATVDYHTSQNILRGENTKWIKSPNKFKAFSCVLPNNLAYKLLYFQSFVTLFLYIPQVICYTWLVSNLGTGSHHSCHTLIFFTNIFLFSK